MSSVTYKHSFCQLLFQSIWDCFGHSEPSQAEGVGESHTGSEEPITTMASPPIYMICVRCSNEMLLNNNNNNLTTTTTNTDNKTDHDNRSLIEPVAVLSPAQATPTFPTTTITNNTNNSLPFPFSPTSQSLFEVPVPVPKSYHHNVSHNPKRSRSVLSMNHVIQLLNHGGRSKVTDKVQDPSVTLLDRMSPANYCRISTCEQLHIHELTPKCRETFAPSSTCSSCQFCDEYHRGHQNMFHHFGRKSAERGSSRNSEYDPGTGSDHAEDRRDARSLDLTLSCALEEYRPHSTPEHLYRIIA